MPWRKSMLLKRRWLETFGCGGEQGLDSNNVNCVVWANGHPEEVRYAVVEQLKSTDETQTMRKIQVESAVHLQRRKRGRPLKPFAQQTSDAKSRFEKKLLASKASVNSRLRNELSATKPTACSKSECIHQSSLSGSGFSLEEELVAQPRVVELLITLLASSMLSRRDIDVQELPYKIINPRPKAQQSPNMPPPSHCGQLSVHEISLFFALKNLPSIDELSQMAVQGILVEKLDKIDTRLYPLLQWLMSSSRSIISYVPPKAQFKQMKTPHQFSIDYQGIESRPRFEMHKKVHGSFYAFHGSTAFAWASILKRGLKNLSSSSDMVHGAVKGNGVYFTTSLQNSLLYSQPTKLNQPWTKSRLGQNPRIVGLCELVNSPSRFTYSDALKTPANSICQDLVQGELHVVPQQDLQALRYLFIYDETTSLTPSNHIVVSRVQ